MIKKAVAGYNDLPLLITISGQHMITWLVFDPTSHSENLWSVIKMALR